MIKSIRARVALVVILVALASTAASHLIQRHVLYEKFLDLEQHLAVSDLARCTDAISQQVEDLGRITRDWATWTDTYEYAKGAKPEFIAENTQMTALANLGWNLLMFVSADGRVLFRWGRDYDNECDLDFPELAGEAFPLTHPLLASNETEIESRGVRGILRTKRGPLLIASISILTSESTGPSTGWIVTGRLLSKKVILALRDQAHVQFQAWLPDDAEVDVEAVRALAKDSGAEGSTFEDRTEPEKILHVAGMMPDLFGKTGIVIRADIPRDIKAEAVRTMTVATTSMVGAGACTVVVLLLLLGVTVVSPLRRLTGHATQVGESGRLSEQSGIKRSDEIGRLATAFDGMVVKLAESRAQLTDVARQAGMADVARSVLHNVGNVLTSVNVSAGTIESTVRRSRVDGLLRGVQLIGDRRGDLAEFLTRDERGRMLPDYLTKAAQALQQERAELMAQIEALRGGVHHATMIVESQNKLADGPGFTEETSLDAVLSGAVALVAPSFSRHGVTIETEAPPDTHVVVDRGKLTQILVNLLTNALEAVASRDAKDRRIAVRAELDGDRIRISVEDNGSGIKAEHRQRLFERGFTTKSAGGGLGLHYCAVTARELGGTISGASEGYGLGATFVVDLPARAEATPLRRVKPVAPCVGSAV